MNVSRRGLMKTGGVAAAVGGLSMLNLTANPSEAHAAGVVQTSPLSAEKLQWSTYGDWLEQGQNDAYSMGRWDSFQVRPVQNTNGSFELWERYDRAEADMIRKRVQNSAFNNVFTGTMPSNAEIAEMCWKGAAWCSSYSAVVLNTTWECDIQFPSREGISYAFMLWPDNDSIWPMNEIDILEGTSGQKTTTSNLHWQSKSGEHSSTQQAFTLDTSKKHRYKVVITDTTIQLLVDNKLIRAISFDMNADNGPRFDTSQNMHFVLQFGADPRVLGPNGTAKFNYSPQGDGYFEEKVILTPITIPNGILRS